MTANVRHSSESNEFYTPAWLVEKARYVLGGIDLDPASSYFANQTVKAATYYDIESNGLLQPQWIGRTLLNPPGGLIDATGRPVYRKTKLRRGCTETGACGLPPGHKHQGVNSSAAVWWRALCRQWQLHGAGRFFVGFSLELLQSCQAGEDPPFHPLQFPRCVPRDRIDFDVVVDGVLTPKTDPTHSNILVLLPPRDRTDRQVIDRFSEAFDPVGYTHEGDGY